MQSNSLYSVKSYHSGKTYIFVVVVIITLMLNRIKIANTLCFLCARFYAKCFLCIISLQSHLNHEINLADILISQRQMQQQKEQPRLNPAQKPVTLINMP